MKRCVMLLGGSGARVAEALVYAACAGALEAPDMHLMLVDPDRRDPHGEHARALCQSYSRMYGLYGSREREEFGTEIVLHTWPDRLPGGASTLTQWTQDTPEDRLLRQALFAPSAATLDMNGGFQGDRALAATAFAGLVQEAERNPADSLARLVSQLQGERVQIVLAGSLGGGTGAAGIPALAAYLRRQLGEQAQLSAVLMLPYGAQEDAAQGKAALLQLAAEELNMSVCLLGLPEGARIRDRQDAARLNEWLAVRAIDWLLRHDASDQAAYTCRAGDGVLSWDIFGKEADKYRSCYLRLVKTAMLFRLHLTGELRQRIINPNPIADRMAGWYAACCRHGVRHNASKDVLQALMSLTSLLDGACAWLLQIFDTLPPEIRYARAIAAAKRTAQENYQATVDLAAQLEILARETKEADDSREDVVHRGGEQEIDELAEMREQLKTMEEKLEALREAQPAMNRRTGGSASMAMYQETLEACQRDADAVRVELWEATRRINQSEKVAEPQEQYRILAARTKLKRMERNLAMQDARTRGVQRDIAAAARQQVRWQGPDIAAEDEETAAFGLLDAEVLRQFMALTEEDAARRTRQQQQDAENAFTSLVPGDTVTVRQVLQGLSRVKAKDEHPLVCLLSQTMSLVWEETEA